MDIDLGRCLTRNELCDLLKISPKTSRRMDRDGTGPRAVRLSSRVTRYPISDVVEFMSASGLTSPPEIGARPDTHDLAVI